jgi:hypothetical protein
MTNWMVALDDSADSQQALKDVLFMMDKKKDTLYLIAVVEQVAQRYAFTLAQYPILAETQVALEKEARNRLKRVGSRCLDDGKY